MIRSQFSLLIICLLPFLAPSLVIGQNAKSTTWQEAKQTGNGVLTVYWFESRPFIFENDRGELKGIEHDVIVNFAEYVKSNYNVNLKIQWVEASGFKNTLDRVAQSNEPCIGASAFSKTDERNKLVDFSPSYMADIMVMISNKNVPMMENIEDFYKTFANLRAITIRGTTYEKDLIALRKNFEMNFEMEYISSAKNILETIEKEPNSFGFIDLPIYLMYYSNNPAVQVRRQNYYPVKREGYGLLYTKNSDWREPITAYFNNKNFKTEFENILPRYLDLQLYKFVEEFSMKDNANLELLNKEKEIQGQDLLLKKEQIEKQTRANYVLTGLVVLASCLLIITIILYRNRIEQSKQIAENRKNIELKNKQLEKRNQDLIALNEEKNNLIKILAHDMRSPLNQVQGLAQMLTLGKSSIPEEEKAIIQNIQESTTRLSKMISNILDVDAIEGNHLNLVTENIAVAPLLIKLMDGFTKYAQSKSIDLHLACDDPNHRISVDTLYFTQIIENLISNAIKFSPKGMKVNIIVSGNGNKVLISVKDQGPGLTEQDQVNLFKKFQRLSNRPTAGEPSIGLGLSIVKRYTEMMGGRVWCESESGMGAAFNVEFNEVV